MNTDGLEKKKFTVAALLDIKAAFNTVCHKGLLFKLRNSGVVPYLVNSVRSFLAVSTFQVSIGTILSERKNNSAGVPQGAILSPMLFNLYCHDMTVTTDDATTHATYADDTLIATAHTNVNTSIATLQQNIEGLAACFNKWKLALKLKQKQKFLLYRKNRRT